MGRSIVAVVAGYLAMFIGVAIGLAILLASFPDAFPDQPGPYDGPTFVLVLEIVMSLLAALAGGYACGYVARSKEVQHAAVLVGLMAVLGVVSLIGEAGLKPLWSSLAILVLPPAAVLYGAVLRRRQRERAALAQR